MIDDEVIELEIDDGGVEDSVDKMGKLYNEANALKMVSIQRILQAEAQKDPERAAEAFRHSQIALRAILIQLKILSEDAKQDRDRGQSASIDAIWTAMLAVPKLKALVSSDTVRKKVLENLEEMIKKERM